MDRRDTVRIYKYPLPMKDEVTLDLPDRARVLCAQVQDGQPYVWTLVDTTAPVRPRILHVVGTGHPFPAGNLVYVGTVQLDAGRLVFHVFERSPDPDDARMPR